MGGSIPERKVKIGIESTDGSGNVYAPTPGHMAVVVALVVMFVVVRIGGPCPSGSLNSPRGLGLSAAVPHPRNVEEAFFRCPMKRCPSQIGGGE